MIALVFLLAMVALPGCGRPESEDGPVRVVVSISPLRGLVGPLLPEGSVVTTLVESGRSVHGFEPTPVHMAAIARADVVVIIGMGLEGRLADAVRHGGSRATLITMAGALDLDGDGHAHSGDHAHDHDECGTHGDAHLWLDPVLAQRFVDVLPGLLPERLREGAAGPAKELAERIGEIDAAFRERLAPFEGRAIVTHHASFNRPAERYGLRVAAVLRVIETLEPSAADIAAARRAIEENGLGAIFIEPQFSGSTAERLAASAGVKLVMLDPLGDGDWIAMMRTNLDRLVEGLSAGRGGGP